MGVLLRGEWSGAMRDYDEGYLGTASQELPPDMLAFVRGKMDSFVKWDVLRFLKENPNAADTEAGLALYVGRKPEVVGPQLEEMAEAGLLQVRQVGDMTVYSLTPDQATRDLITRFLDNCEDRRFRLRVIYHVARSMR